MKGLKTEDFLTKMPKNLAFLFWAKNGQNLAQSSRKWRKKNQIGENGGERKINPSANPDSKIPPYLKQFPMIFMSKFVLCQKLWLLFFIPTFSLEKRVY